MQTIGEKLNIPGTDRIMTNQIMRVRSKAAPLRLIPSFLGKYDFFVSHNISRSNPSQGWNPILAAIAAAIFRCVGHTDCFRNLWSLGPGIHNAATYVVNIDHDDFLPTAHTHVVSSETPWANSALKPFMSFRVCSAFSSPTTEASAATSSSPAKLLCPQMSRYESFIGYFSYVSGWSPCF